MCDPESEYDSLHLLERLQSDVSILLLFHSMFRQWLWSRTFVFLFLFGSSAWTGNHDVAVVRWSLGIPRDRTKIIWADIYLPYVTGKLLLGFATLINYCIVCLF